MLCIVNLAAVHFATRNFAEAPRFCVVHFFADTTRNIVVCRALQAQGSLVTGATQSARRDICHTLPVMRVKLFSGPDM